VISVPLFFLACGTNKKSESPAIILFLCGKVRVVQGCFSLNSDIISELFSSIFLIKCLVVLDNHLAKPKPKTDIVGIPYFIESLCAYWSVPSAKPDTIAMFFISFICSKNLSKYFSINLVISLGPTIHISFLFFISLIFPI
jgi:hypothetical protein